jgi:CheY-like chemotaxis protein
MPGMDGVELTRRLRERCKEKAIVTMISSGEWSLIADKALSAGVDRFLAKPLFPSNIADCINQCLGRPPSKIRPKEENTVPQYPGKCVLVAEDVEINREIVNALLENTGLKISFAENGALALDMYKANPAVFDMIFMDLQMPEMDGYESTRLIRDFEASQIIQRRIPIIAMTANVFKEDIERCLIAGMDGHVGKPLNMDEVITCMNKFLVQV